MKARAGRGGRAARFPLRRVLLLLGVAVAAAALLDWWLGTLLRRESLEEFSEAVPIPVERDQELVLLKTVRHGDELLAHDPDAEELDVGVRLAGSRLSDRTQRRLRRYAPDWSPAEGQEITVTTGTPDGSPALEAGEALRCRTRVAVTAEAATPGGESGDTVRLHLSQTASARGGREVTLRPEGRGVRVAVETLAPPGPDLEPVAGALGCFKWVAAQRRRIALLPAPLFFEAVVPPGGTATFRFDGGPDRGAALAPFELGPVRSLEVLPCPGCEPLVWAPGLGGDDLEVGLEITGRGLRVALEGRGPLERAFRYVAEDRTLAARARYWLRTHPILGFLWVSLTIFIGGLATTYLFERPWAAALRWLRGARGDEPPPGADVEAPDPRRPGPPARDPSSRPAPGPASAPGRDSASLRGSSKAR